MTPSQPAIPPQPAGKHGHTYRVLNWKQFHSGLITAYKASHEAYAESVDVGHVTPDYAKVVDQTTKSFKTYLGPLITKIHQKNWTVPKQALVVIRSAAQSKQTAVVKACEWVPSITFVDKKTHRLVAKPPQEWYRDVTTLKLDHGIWRDVGEVSGKFPCPKVPPKALTY